MTPSKPENMMPAKTKLGRRVLAVLGIGATAAAAVLAGATRPVQAMKPPANKGGPAYRESEHIKQFYKVNRY